jgi:hypothetical protein
VVADVSAISLATTLRNLAQNLARDLRSGNALISDARVLESLLRETEGWLITCRNELDPEEPAL